MCEVGSWCITQENQIDYNSGGGIILYVYHSWTLMVLNKFIVWIKYFIRKAFFIPHCGCLSGPG